MPANSIFNKLCGLVRRQSYILRCSGYGHNSRNGFSLLQLHAPEITALPCAYDVMPTPVFPRGMSNKRHYIAAAKHARIFQRYIVAGLERGVACEIHVKWHVFGQRNLCKDIIQHCIDLRLPHASHKWVFFQHHGHAIYSAVIFLFPYPHSYFRYFYHKVRYVGSKSLGLIYRLNAPPAGNGYNFKLPFAVHPCKGAHNLTRPH